MRLTIEHETHYRFEEQAKHSIQYLRMTPRRDLSQRVIQWEVTTPGGLRSWVDGFGNLTHVSVQETLHDEVPVHVRGVVETVDKSGVLPADDGMPPLIFLRETEYTKVEDNIEEFAAPFRDQLQALGALDALHALMAHIHAVVAYRQGHTHVHSTASDALAHGCGVCQDHAHLFIACCRVLGIPARYVSGYLWGGIGDGDDPHLHSHAWADALVDGLGWVGFDPSNKQCATDAYVRLAVGFDYASACPVRGVRRGGGEEMMDVKVVVEQNQ